MSGTPVEVTRTGQHAFMAVNPRGGKVAIGREDAADSFTPGELLLAAIAGCSALTGENLLVRLKPYLIALVAVLLAVLRLRWDEAGNVFRAIRDAPGVARRAPSTALDG